MVGTAGDPNIISSYNKSSLLRVAAGAADMLLTSSISNKIMGFHIVVNEESILQ